MTHDSSTLGGNSGSAVIDVATGTVIGLHFAGEYLKANYAVPTYELARDRRVADAGLNFQGSVAPTAIYDTAWAGLEGHVPDEKTAKNDEPRPPTDMPPDTDGDMLRHRDAVVPATDGARRPS